MKKSKKGKKNNRTEARMRGQVQHRKINSALFDMLKGGEGQVEDTEVKAGFMRQDKGAWRTEKENRMWKGKVASKGTEKEPDIVL